MNANVGSSLRGTASEEVIRGLLQIVAAAARIGIGLAFDEALDPSPPQGGWIAGRTHAECPP